MANCKDIFTVDLYKVV